MNLDALVLAPCMAVWGRPITVTPLLSQPSTSPFLARGVWEIVNVSIPIEGGGVFSNTTIKLGIRLSEFAVAPEQGDWISTKAKDLPMAYTLAEQIAPDTNVDFIVDDQGVDGQGGAKLTLKRIIK